MTSLVKNYHLNNRQKICLLCLKYQNQYKHSNKSVRYQKVLATDEIAIREHFIPTYFFVDDIWPSVLCSTCKRALNESKKGVFRRKTITYDWKSIQKFSLRVLKDSICKCFFCKLVDKMVATGSYKNKENVRDKITDKGIRCHSCLSMIKRGASHQCNKRSLITHATQILQKTELEQAVVAKFVVEKRKENFQKISLKNFRGKPTTLQLSMVKEVEPIDLSDLMEFQKDITGSNRKSIKLLTKLRKKGMKVQPNLFIEFEKEISDVHDFFSESDETVEVGPESTRTRVTRKIVYCHRLKEFIMFSYHKRQFTPGDILVKFSCDVGGGSIKITVTVMPKNNQTDEKSGKLGSVKRIFLIALAENVPETHFNLQVLFNLIGLTDLCDFPFDCWFTGDLKIYNKSFGLQEHACLHPCVYCDAEKSQLHSDNYTHRTFGDIREQNKKWLESGGDKKRLSEFKNCIGVPVFKDTPDEATTMEFAAPNELHLMTGGLNTFCKQIEKFDKDGVNNWSKSHNAKKSGMSGDFNGNDSRKLLKNYESLRKFIITDADHYVSILGAFNNVVEACFGQVLLPDWKQKLEIFTSLLHLYNIKFTPKLHIIVFHIMEFIEMYETALGIYSEQAAESVHHDWKIFYQNYTGNAGQSSSRSLLSAVIKFNTLNM